MALYDNWPYTDFSKVNLDWIINEVKNNNTKVEDLEQLFYNKVSEEVIRYINENLSQFLLGAMYDEANTSIKLQQATVIGDSDHVYNNEKIVVLEGR